MDKTEQDANRSSLAIALLPMMMAVFVAFMVTGLALPVLPLHVHSQGFGGLAIGVVAGAQFAASLLARVWAGNYSDTRGSKRAVMYGLIAASLAGFLYQISFAVRAIPEASLAILVVGRALLGGGESFIITGALSWGLFIGGTRNTGKVIAWMGTAMYAALAVGAPLGVWLYSYLGFVSVAVATITIPLATLGAVSPLKSIAPQRRLAGRGGRTMIKVVALPGLGLAMASLGLGAVLTFASLLFAERGWAPLWVGVTTFAGCFIAARIFFGHLSDVYGGGKVAFICLAIEAAGLSLVWASSWEVTAIAGFALAGFGYSLVYPALGSEAVRRAGPEMRGLAMGSYTAFLDLMLFAASPVLRLVAQSFGTAHVFSLSSAGVLTACPIAWVLMRPAASGDVAKPGVP